MNFKVNLFLNKNSVDAGEVAIKSKAVDRIINGLDAGEQVS